jgi:hypothetical protein
LAQHTTCSAPAHTQFFLGANPDTVAVTGNGTYTTGSGNNAGGYLPTATGTYQWIAAYSGDSNNATAASSKGSEPESVTSAAPSINTTPGAAVVIGSGSKLSDSATLSGGYNDTGTITFTLDNSSNVAVYTDTVTVNGNGTYTTASGWPPLSRTSTAPVPAPTLW